MKLGTALFTLIFSPYSLAAPTSHGGDTPSYESRGGPIQIGSHHTIVISSSDAVTDLLPVVSADGTTATYTLHHENASYLSVHFNSMDLPPDCSLKMSDAIGEQFNELHGKGKFDMGTFWGRHIKGDTMILALHCTLNLPTGDAVFEINDYVAGFPNLVGSTRKTRNLRSPSSVLPDETKGEAPFVPSTDEAHRDLSICGADDKRNAVCFMNTHPTEYVTARAVARLFINGSGVCTGFLVTGTSLLFTNEHCLNSVNDARNTDYEFIAEEPTCTNVPGDGSVLGNPGDVYDAIDLVAVSATWDYVLVQLIGNPADLYGYLELDGGHVEVNEEIYIPQHPGGRAKELGIFDTNHDGNCKVMDFITQGACSPQVMTYSCDTEGGSSGSPVLSRSTHKVIGLHQCGGGCGGNQGVPVSQFLAEVVQFVAACTLDSHCNDSNVCTLDVCHLGQCTHTDILCLPPTSAPTPVPGVNEFLTTFAHNNRSWGNIFKIQAKPELTILGFDIHTEVTGSYPVAVWTRAGEPAFNNNDGQWTMIQETTVQSQGVDNRTPLPLLDTPLLINAGETVSFYISGTNSTGMRYTDGVSEGAIFSQNDDLIFFEGRGVRDYPFSPRTFSPRVWNGVIKYAVSPSATRPPTQSPTPAPAPPPFLSNGPCINYELELLTDTWGDETSWKIARDSDGFVVAGGGGYPSLTSVTETGCIPDDCYRFSILDSFGDGLGHAYNPIHFPHGMYTLKNEGNLMGTGGDFGFVEVVLYGTCANAIEKVLKKGADFD